MIRFLADENFHGAIVRGLLLRNHALDLVTIQEMEIDGLPDPDVLQWAHDHDRVVLSHDQRTMPMYAYERIGQGQRMRGLVIVNDWLPIAQVIDDVLLMDACSEQQEWDNQVIYLPL